MFARSSKCIHIDSNKHVGHPSPKTPSKATIYQLHTSYDSIEDNSSDSRSIARGTSGHISVGWYGGICPVEQLRLKEDGMTYNTTDQRYWNPRP